MPFYIHVPAVKVAALNATSTMSTVSIDRNCRLSKVILTARETVTHNGVNYSQINVKAGSDLLASRVFNASSLTALTPESLTVDTAKNDLEDGDVLNIQYDFSANGLAVNCDLTLVFEPSRQF